MQTATVTELDIPPHNSEMEQALLGGVLLDNSAWDTIATVVTEDDFYSAAHRKIFAAISALAEAGEPMDWHTVNERLEDDHLAYLGELAKETPSAANTEHYARAVRDYSVRRRLMLAGQEIRGLAMLPGGMTVPEALDKAEAKVMKVARGRQDAEQPSVKEALLKVVDKIDAMYQSGSSISGLPTGFNDLDDLTCGLQPGELVIIGGRPSMGKTAMGMNIAEYIAVEKRLPVGVFSLEMPREALLMRMLASIGRIEFSKLRSGQLDDGDWPKLIHATGLLNDANDCLHIDDTAGLSVLELRAKARRMKREHDIRLIIVDYLQLMRGEGENRNLEVGAISAGLKSIAKELEVPLVAISQLSRAPEQRTNKRPNLADLRDSGSIEQDADVVMFLYRDEVSHEDSPDKGIAEVIISKQRNGPIGTVRLTFKGELVALRNHTVQWGQT